MSLGSFTYKTQYFETPQIKITFFQKENVSSNKKKESTHYFSITPRYYSVFANILLGKDVTEMSYIPH